MRRLLLLTSAAALVLSMPVAAKDQPHGKGRSAHSQKDRGPARGEARGPGHKVRDAGPAVRSRGRNEAKAERRQARGAAHAQADVRRERRDAAQHRRQRQKEVAVHERAEDRRAHRQRTAARERRQEVRQREQRFASRDRLEDRRERRQESRGRERQRRLAALESRQALRQRGPTRERLQERWRDREHFFTERARRYRTASYDWDDYDYRYLYRNVAPAYFSSTGDFLPIGRAAPPPWAPAWGRRSNLPARYQDVYYDTPYDYYRYDDGYIYRVDSDSNLIADVIPLLGGGFAVGQLMPVGYDAYNVPYPYRDYYYDTPDAYYRYGDGGIFQVDPTTGMIEAIVALLAGDLNIGQPLPAGYDAYNLPFQYRDQYVDNDDYIYRYNDGNIYQADARSGLIQNVIAAAL